MSALFAEVESFVDRELIPMLRSMAAEYATGLGSPKPVTIDIIADAKLKCRVFIEESAYRITLSRGWLFRLTIVFHLFEHMWLTRDFRPKLWALNINSAFDSFFFAEASDPRTNFMFAPDLGIPFLELDDEREQWKLLCDFQDKFNCKRNGMEFLQFSLPGEVSEKVKGDVAIAFSYLILHEFFHIARDHVAFFRQSNNFALSEALADGSYFSFQQASASSYLKKAAEVDADAFALYFIVAPRIRTTDKPLIEAINTILEPILVLISMLDLGRRSLTDYQTSISSHPAPDVRVFCSWQAFKERTRQLGDDLDEQINAAMEKAITYCAKSFQQLGMASGAFYLLENRQLTLDDQFYFEIVLMVLLQEEICGIEAMYRWIVHVRENGEPSVKWEYTPLGMTKAEFKTACKTELKRILTQGEPPTESTESWLKRQLIKARQRLGIGDKDLLLLMGDPSMKSPFMGGDSASLHGMDPKVRYQAVMGQAWQALSKYADAKWR